MAGGYIGSELEVFSLAKNWRAYWSDTVTPYLGLDVLEVGAGLGSVTRLLSANANRWTALEPDSSMAAGLRAETLPPNTSVVCGTIDSIEDGESYDTVLYIDVLEHIESHALELEKAARLLRPGGNLILLAPAYNWLMSPFDHRIGHFRRYTKKSLASICPRDFVSLSANYLDFFGLLASVANKILLRQGQPRRSQILFWDSVLIPMSKVADRVSRHQLGKSVLVVWQKK